MSRVFASGVQSIGASASTSVLPMNIKGWFPLGSTGLISLQSKALSRVFSNNSKAAVLQCSAFFVVQLSHLYMTTGKTVTLTIWTSVGKVMSLLLNTMSWFVIAFLPRSTFILMPSTFYYLNVVLGGGMIWWMQSDGLMEAVRWSLGSF